MTDTPHPVTPRILIGRVEPGYGLATGDGSEHLQKLCDAMGLDTLFPGTLNLRIDQKYETPPLIVLEPSQWNGLDYARLQRCRVRGLRCLLYKPYPVAPLPNALQSDLDVLEIMSDRSLRDEFDLIDGSPLEVEVEGDDGWWAVPNRVAV